MKALVYHGPGKRAWDTRPRPVLQLATDAVVRIARTTICGSDLHILKGDVPTVTEGRILGHEGLGVVEEVGSAVFGFKAGDRVLISCITSCGKCEACRKGMYSHCGNGGGWILGNRIDGTQAEYVRIPFADTSLYHVPEGSDEDALVMLSDILPTGFECGVLKGQVKPGDTVAIVGAGPVGLAVLLTAQFFSPAEIIMVDVDDNRLAAAMALGASRTPRDVMVKDAAPPGQIGKVFGFVSAGLLGSATAVHFHVVDAPLGKDALDGARETRTIRQQQHDRGNAPGHADHGDGCAPAVVYHRLPGLAENVSQHESTYGLRPAAIGRGLKVRTRLVAANFKAYSFRRASIGSSAAALLAG